VLSHIWVKSESDLDQISTKSLTSFNQSWYARNTDLQINIQKCEFNVEETVFLKIIVFKQDLCMNSIKVKAIVNWATFTNLKEIQDFVNFINNFLKLVKSFTQLTWKDMSFVWSEVCVEVFVNLKKQISLISVLCHFNVKRQAILKIDAFNYVKDDILSQYDDENVLHCYEACWHWIEFSQ